MPVCFLKLGFFLELIVSEVLVIIKIIREGKRGGEQNSQHEKQCKQPLFHPDHLLNDIHSYYKLSVRKKQLPDPLQNTVDGLFKL